MRIWLFKTGEPLPCDPGTPRRMRTGMLAETLAERGHDVVWWTSTFNQVNRTDRFSEDTVVEPMPGYRLRMLHAQGYRKNVSLARLRYNRRTAESFKRRAATEAIPDIILCSMPTIENALVATRYGRERNVPVVLDCRDMWPDIILDRFPQKSRWVAKQLIRPMFTDLSRAAAQARAITGITDAFVEWGLSYANRPRTVHDQAFPLAYSTTPPSGDDRVSAHRFWRQQGIQPNQEFLICFFGNISPRYELDDVLRAARILQDQQVPCRFVICGDGEALPKLKAQATGLANVTFPGWVGAPEIWTLMRIADIGIVPYPSTKDYYISVPNKAIEYLSAGLPVITSLDGTLRNLLSDNQCGVHYKNGDVGQLTTVVTELSQAENLRQRMSVAAKRLFNAQFDAAHVYARMCDYLEELAMNHPGRKVARAAA